METTVQSTEKEIEDLLAEWMNRQDITWAAEDAPTKQKLRGILERGMAYLRNSAGAPSLSFTGDTKSLLFDYCRYDLNNCREEFAKAFTADLTLLRLTEGFHCGQTKARVALMRARRHLKVWYAKQVFYLLF
ncbi:MAG: hypothetical protein PHG02_04800 [Oscillospiraceae bacterium]|nr:hypothetical protein [Oscillospiraceae bacterium]